MKPTPRSSTGRPPLPRAPLDFAYPLLIRPPGPEGAVIIAELNAETAPVLLRALRIAHLWCRKDVVSISLSSAALRAWEGELRGGNVPPGLQAPLGALIQEWCRRQPDADVIGRNCFAVSEWALAAHAESTALAFAESAACVAPTNARFAWMAGRLLRNCGRMREAELWLRRAVRVAVWTEDTETQDLALNSIGNLYVQTGSFRDALRYLGRALIVARKLPKERRGAVTHDLFTLLVLTGDHARAEGLAGCALDLYGAGHPRLPILANDIAQLWMRQGRFQIAFPVLRALRALARTTEERLRIDASLVRAAAACGDRACFELGWRSAWSLIEHPDGAARAILPSVLVDLGKGAATLGDWERAAKVLTRAVECARQRGAHEDAADAESTLDMVGRQERVDAMRRPAFGPAAQLSDALVRTLGEAAPPEGAELTGSGAT